MSRELDPHRLRIFLAVAEERHFGSAARRLFISQPTVSHHVRSLERDLGVRLLERTARSVTLTPPGALLAEQARKLLDDGERLIHQVRALAADGATPLQVALGTGADGGHLMQQGIDAFRRSRPHVRVVTHYTYGHQLTPLRTGSVDLALTYLPFSEQELEGIDVTVVREEPRAVYLAADHRLARRATLEIEDIADETFFDAPSAPGFSPTWVDFWTLRAARNGRGSTFDQPVSSYEDNAAAIAQGQAVALAPVSAISYYQGRNMVAVPVRDAEPARTALLRVRRHRSEHVLALVRATQQVAASNGQQVR